MAEIKLLYLASNEWGNLGRRKVRLAHEFADQPGLASILYVNPPVTTSPLDILRGEFLPSHLGSDKQAHLDALRGQARQVKDRLWVYTGSTKTVPLTRMEKLRQSSLLNGLNDRLYVAGLRRQLRHLPGGRLVIWLSHPLQISWLDHFPECELVCYDWTDDWLQFELLPVARQELEAASEAILRRADIIFAVSESLRRRAEAVNPQTYRAPNASDFELISQALDAALTIPSDLKPIPSPRLGYIGQIADNVDFAMIRVVAEARPDWSLVFVGPIWENRQEEVNCLTELGNVHFLGGRPHGQLASYLRGFDACLLPHLLNPLTTSMDPTKLYDYLSSGNPIVSTSVAGTERFLDVLYLGDTSAAFISGIEAALTEPSAQREKRLNYARQNNWADRAAEMWQVIMNYQQKVRKRA